MAGNLLAVALVSLGILLLNLVAAHEPGFDRPALGPGPVVVPPSVSVSPSPSPSLSLSPTPLVRPPLTVLNSSRRTGLAARAADGFRAAGWPIAGTGNYRQRVPVTTVYFAPGQEAAARQLVAEFPAIQRVLPRPPDLPGTGLTVVVTREYPA